MLAVALSCSPLVSRANDRMAFALSVLRGYADQKASNLFVPSFSFTLSFTLSFSFSFTLYIRLAFSLPLIGGVLVFGDRGTGKSTAVRSLAALLPPMQAVKSCPYQCDPQQSAAACPVCKGMRRRQSITVPVPVVDLPLGATEDRVLGALDLQKALREAVKAFEPGLLAKAHRGFLYVDEVNLLKDHLVDLLLDVAASGENLVEREGLSLRHPARFVLVGSGNPEEGELRPQLLDRFG